MSSSDSEVKEDDRTVSLHSKVEEPSGEISESSLEIKESSPELIPIVEQVAEKVIVKAGEVVVEETAETVVEVAKEVEKDAELVGESAAVVEKVGDEAESVVRVTEEVAEAASEAAKVIPGMPPVVEEVAESIEEGAQGIEVIVDTVTSVAEKVGEVAEEVVEEAKVIENKAVELIESKEKREELVEKVIDFAGQKLSELSESHLEGVTEAKPVAEATESAPEKVIDSSPILEMDIEKKETIATESATVPATGKKQSLFDKFLSLFSKDEDEERSKEAAGAIEKANGAPPLSESELAPLGQVKETHLESIATKVGEGAVEDVAKVVVEVAKEVEKDAELVSESAAVFEKVGGEAESVLKVTEEVGEAVSEAAKEVPGMPSVVEEVAEQIEEVMKEAEVIADTVTSVAEKVEEVAKEVIEEAKAIEAKAVELIESEEKREELVEKVVDFIGEKLAVVESSEGVTEPVKDNVMKLETVLEVTEPELTPIPESGSEKVKVPSSDSESVVEMPQVSEVKTPKEGQVEIKKQGLFDKLLNLFTKDEDEKGLKKSDGVALDLKFSDASVDQVNEETVVQESTQEAPVAEPLAEHMAEKLAEKVGEVVIEDAAKAVVEVTKEVEKDAELVSESAAVVEKISSEAESVMKVTEEVAEAASEAAKEVPGMPSIIEEVAEHIEEVVKEAEVIADTVTSVAGKVEEVTKEVIEEAKVIEAKAVELIGSEEKREELVEKVFDFVGEKLSEVEVSEPLKLVKDTTHTDPVVAKEGFFDKLANLFKEKEKVTPASETKLTVGDIKDVIIEGEQTPKTEETAKLHEEELQGPLEPGVEELAQKPVEEIQDQKLEQAERDRKPVDETSSVLVSEEIKLSGPQIQSSEGGASTDKKEGFVDMLASIFLSEKNKEERALEVAEPTEIVANAPSGVLVSDNQEAIPDLPSETVPEVQVSLETSETTPDVTVETVLETLPTGVSSETQEIATQPLEEIQKGGLIGKIIDIFTKDDKEPSPQPLKHEQGELSQEITAGEPEKEMKEEILKVPEVETKASVIKSDESSKEGLAADEKQCVDVKDITTAESAEMKTKTVEDGGLLGKLVDFFSQDAEKKNAVQGSETTPASKEVEPVSASTESVGELSDENIEKETDFVIVEHSDIKEDQESVAMGDEIAIKNDTEETTEKSKGLFDKLFGFASNDKTEEATRPEVKSESTSPSGDSSPESLVIEGGTDSQSDSIKTTFEKGAVPHDEDVKEHEAGTTPKENSSSPAEERGGGLFEVIGNLFVKEKVDETSEQISEPVTFDKSKDGDRIDETAEVQSDTPSEVTITSESPVLEVSDSSLFDRLSELVSGNDKISSETSDVSSAQEILPQEVPKPSEAPEQPLTETSKSQTEPSLFDRVASIFSKEDESALEASTGSDVKGEEQVESELVPVVKETTSDEEDPDVFVVLSKPTTPVETPVSEEGHQETEKASGSWLQGSWFRSDSSVSQEGKDVIIQVPKETPEKDFGQSNPEDNDMYTTRS